MLANGAPIKKYDVRTIFALDCHMSMMLLMCLVCRKLVKSHV